MVVLSMPLVCTETLESLEDSLDGERALCRSFVCRYIDMWPERFARICDAVTAGHKEHAMDAILSLRSSSLMVGAVQLGDLANEVVKALETGHCSAAAPHLSALRRCGNRTTGQLASGYVNAA